MATPSDDKDDQSKDSIAEEIEEAISISEHISSESSSNNFQFAAKKRQLFDIDDIPNSSSSFKIDEDRLDALLSGGNIAQHFKIDSNSDEDLDKNEEQQQKSSVEKGDDDDSLNEALRELESHSEHDKDKELKEHECEKNIDKDESEKKSEYVPDRVSDKDVTKIPSVLTSMKNSKKEISPFKGDDVILINNDKISLKSLKRSLMDEPSEKTDQNTTNDVSDIGIDETSIGSNDKNFEQNRPQVSRSFIDETKSQPEVKTERESKSLGNSINLSKFIANEEEEEIVESDKEKEKQGDKEDNDSIEEDHSIEEVIVSNASIEITKRNSENSMNEDKAESRQKDKSESNENLKAKSQEDIASFDTKNLSELESDIDINNASQIAKILNETINNLPEAMFEDSDVADTNKDFSKLEFSKIKSSSPLSSPSFREEEKNIKSELREIVDKSSTKLSEHRSDNSLENSLEETLSDEISNLKNKILQNSELKETPRSKLVRDYSLENRDEVVNDEAIKPMEMTEELHEALDDITEESDVSEPKIYSVIATTAASGISTSISSAQAKGEEIRKIIGSRILCENYSAVGTEKNSEENHDSFESVVSLNMFQMLENRVKELQDIVSGKDLCLTALNMQLESMSRRDSLKELPPSGRDSCSLATSSTEYRTYQEDYISKMFDFQNELAERDNLIEQLTISLQQSMQMREQLQQQSDKLSTDVVALRRQLTEYSETVKRPPWLRDQESASVGQRISEISIDLVSESDDAIEDIDKASTDIEEKYQKQLKDNEFVEPQQMPISKQIEQFQKYLSADELRIFFMVRRKFDDYLSEEVEKVRGKFDVDMKALNEQLGGEKHEKECEINRLRNLLASVKSGSTELIELRRELDDIHSKEMENLRTYFEKKCADLEKQYSEEIFSQHSRRHSNDTGSELSDQEQLPDELSLPFHHQDSPKRKKKGEILASPIHKKITPTSIGVSPMKLESSAIKQQDEQDPVPTVDELNSFYRDKIKEINRNHDDTVRNLKLQLKHFECRHTDDDYTVPKDVQETSTNNEIQIIDQIAGDYERRLDEQVQLAKEDMLRMLEEQIQALLSETATDDSQWPPELILLREKFTAKSQLEIAQLQIKHEEKMERLKSDYEKQLHRKLKRHTTFDTNRDIDQVLLERDNLRELCSTFRKLLRDFAKCVSACEVDLNQTLADDLNRFGIDLNGSDSKSINLDDSELNHSYQSNVSTKNGRLMPDVSGILNLVEDPSLVNFVDQNVEIDFNLNECLERLNNEAVQLLKISENLCRKNRNGYLSEKDQDSCEESDGLKNTNSSHKRTKAKQTSSLNENMLSGRERVNGSLHRASLPMDYKFSDQKNKNGPSSELNVQLNELKNRLLHSENERKNLASELAEALRKYENLAQMLCLTKEHLEQLESHKEDVSEGYGISQLQSPSRHQNNSQSSYSELQNTARNILNLAPNGASGDGAVLMQHVENFCGKLDKFVEEEKNLKSDLQNQIDAADKQKKATLQFLEEQAAEREQERDDFTKEIDMLKGQLRDKERECNSFIRIMKEAETMEQQIREMTASIGSYEDKKQKLEADLRASIDKIYDLREIITELEKQNEDKSKTEHLLNEKIKALESHIKCQLNKNSSLQDEVDSLKNEFMADYKEKIVHLEDQIRSMRPSAEQSIVIDQMTAQLKEIESNLDRKTKNLESLHATVCSTSCSSPCEDVSVHGRSNINSPAESPRTPRSLPIDDVQRIMEKLIRHNRAEEAAIKRMHDLEMQINSVRTSYNELQHERDILQEKMSEQILRISTLQSRLDEQRHRAEELHRQGTTDLNIKVYELQSQLTNAQEKLTAREKQITTLKDHLEQSKVIIDRLEAELAAGSVDGGNSMKFSKLEDDLKAITEENIKLKEKIRNEMINKLALPDLMETMLADKNEEIDHLREQLESKQTALQVYLDLHLDDRQLAELQRNAREMVDGKSSARTLSDILSLSEYDESDVVRKVASDHRQDLNVISIDRKIEESSPKFFALPQSSQQLNESALLGKPSYFADLSGLPKSDCLTPSPQPRQINFSQTIDEMNVKLGDSLKGNEQSNRSESLNKADKELSELRDKLATLSALELEVDRLRCANEEKMHQINELKDKLVQSTELQVSLTEKNKLLTDLMNEKKVLKSELEELKVKANRLTDLQQELSMVRARLAEKDQEIIDMNLRLCHHSKDDEGLVEMLTVEKNELTEKVDILNQQVESLNKTILHKDELLSKHEKNALNFAQTETRHLEQINNLEKEIMELHRDFDRNQLEAQLVVLKEDLEHTKSELFEKLIAYEKSQLYLKQQTKTIEELKELITERKSPRSVDEMRIQIRSEKEKTQRLQEEVEILKNALQRSENNDSPKPYSIDELAKRVEKELNYSAQLDSNILNAIESDDVNSDEDHHLHKLAPNELISLKEKYENEKMKCQRLQRLLDSEKNNSVSLQEQDANVIQAINLRLEAALTQETEIQKQLEEERMKNERLTAQLLVYQRTVSRDNSLKSPQDSPRRQRSNDFESELANRLQSEIKLLSAQNERERERVMDIERVMEREKSRFEKELSDRKEYGEQMKRETERLIKEKETLEYELEHVQERLSLSSREVETLEARIASLQEVESRRIARRGKERNDTAHHVIEIQELKLRLNYVEKERDKLQEKILGMHDEIGRCAQRESQLNHQLELIKGHSVEGIVPKQFLQKLNNMNSLIVDNTKENKQLSETLQFLTAERHTLQHRVAELELKNRAFNREELEERANHLFGKYLRVESYRKALVHQKKYLMIVLQTYQENEAKAVALITGKHSPKTRKPKSFRSAVFVVIAIERMKYIVRRWQVGRRVASKAIFSHQMPRRSASASTNAWVRSDSLSTQSPPSRDRPPYATRSTLNLSVRPLQSPSLIAECSERLENLAARSKWS